MSKRKKKKRKPGPSKRVQATPKRRFPVVWVAIIIVAVIVAAGLVVYNRMQTGQEQAAVSVTGESTDRQDPSSKKSAGFQNLIGRRQRPDGGYIIEIRHIDPEGRMDAAYLNPRPINVSKAEASWKEGVQQVFIEMQKNKDYPGSTYTLDYNPNQDMLTGIYFQAVLGQNFEVVFVQKK